MFSTPPHRGRRRAASALVAAAAVLTLASACAEPAATAPSSDPSPVIVDYSPTVSDAGALLYVAARPDVDLLAVTLPSTGEAECEPGARITRSLLAVADRDGVPVGCGAEVPAEGRNAWPAEWRAEANHLPGVVLPGSPDVAPEPAEELLADAIDAAEEAVTIVATGPLTNIGRLVTDRPDLVDRIARVVVMGGAVAVDGNVEAAPAAEWNLHVDPIAAHQVLASGVEVVVVPLDVTNQLPWTPQLVARLGGAEHAAGRAAHQIVSGRASLEGIFLWDELAAVVALEPTVVTTESMALTVDPSGALVPDPEGRPAAVAMQVDADAATAEYLRTLNGGHPVPIDELTAAEAAYIQNLAATMDRIDRRFEEMAPPPSAPPVELATLMVETFWPELAELRDELAATEPPASFTGVHHRFHDAVANAVAIRDDVLAAVAASQEHDPWHILDGALQEVAPRAFHEVTDACGELEARSLVSGGPELCGLFGE